MLTFCHVIVSSGVNKTYRLKRENAVMAAGLAAYPAGFSGLDGDGLVLSRYSVPWAFHRCISPDLCPGSTLCPRHRVRPGQHCSGNTVPGTLPVPGILYGRKLGSGAPLIGFIGGLDYLSSWLISLRLSSSGAILPTGFAIFKSNLLC
jgi:hypothetical protein